MSEPSRYPWILCLLSLLVFFAGLGSRDFWAPVEPRYAEIARVMVSKDHWLVPTVNGELYTDKPILYFWLVLIGSQLAGGVNEWTVRLPSAVSGLGLVLTTYALGRDFFSPRVGLIAGAILATTARVVWEARWAHTDMLFTFLFSASMYLFARAMFHKGRPAEVLAAYALMGLATLTKGLIGVVLPGLILAAFLVARKDWRIIFTWRLSLGIAVFLLVAAPWFAWVSVATDGKWLEEFLYVHHFQRYTAGFGHRQPFYYYLTTLPRDFLPWTIFAVPALFAYRPGRKLWQEPACLFFALWFCAVFLFFSASDTKRDLYLLPLLPAAALFLALYLDDLAAGKVVQGALYRWLMLLFFNLLWIGALATPIAAWFVRRETVWISVPFSLVTAGGALVVVCAVLRRQAWRAFQSTVAMTALGMVCASIWILPYVNQFKSRLPFSLEVKKLVPLTEPLFIYADTMNDFNFYMEREVIPVISSRSEVENLLSENRSGYLLIRDKDSKRLGLRIDDRVQSQGSVGSETWYLIVLGARAVNNTS